MTYYPEESIVQFGHKEVMPGEDGEHIPSLGETLEEAAEILKAVFASSDDNVAFPAMVGAAFLEAFVREMDGSPNRVQMVLYPLSGFASVHTELWMHDGYDLGDDDDIEETPEERVQTYRDRANASDEAAGELTNRLAELLTEPDTPDRQYRIDDLNERIVECRTMADRMRAKADEIEQGGDQ